MLKHFFICILVFISTAVLGQSSITGKVVDSNKEPVKSYFVKLIPTNQKVLTNSEGLFNFSQLPAGEYKVVFVESQQELDVTIGKGKHYRLKPYQVNIVEKQVKKPVLPSKESEGSSILTDLNVLEASDESTSVSSLLTASRDVFLNKAGFQFGSDVFFRVRGYDSKYSDFMLNGVRFENPETGWQPFNLVGGLNDALRYRDEETVGLNYYEKGIGEIGGARNYNLRPSEYGKGGRFTYSNLNKTYNNRVMGTYSSGEKDNFSYVVSGSKRWAQNPYIEGNYYDSYAGFGAIETKVNDNYSVALSAILSPRRRGTHSIHRQEVYDLAGSNYYSADWGTQDNQKRNSRLRKNFNPIFMLSNYLTISDKTKAQLTASYLTGYYKYSRLERINGTFNPDPDYYQNLPSFAGDNAPFFTQQQIDWNTLYNWNTSNINDGDNFAGNRSMFILEDNNRDDNDFQLALQLQSDISNQVSLTYGGNFRNYKGNFYKTVNDLLGGAYWLDVDSYTTDPNTGEALQNNLDRADIRVEKDEKFGYDYNLNKSSYDAFAQGNIELNKFNIFGAASFGQESIWRTGNIKTGQAPDNSMGKGEKKDFMTYSGKAGVTYKFDNRNYFSLNGMAYNKPPTLNTMYTSVRVRDNIHPRVKEEQIYSGEFSYNHKSPSLKLRFTGYGTRINNQAESLLAFTDAGNGEGGQFGNIFVHDIDKLHVGTELGFDTKISPTFSISGASAIGKYTYMSRPVVSQYADANNQPAFPERSAFLLNFYEDNTPQTAFNLGVTYRAKKGFFANADFNYYANSYVSPSALRRTIPVARNLTIPQGMNEEQAIAHWTKQEKLPEEARLNLSLYKEIFISYEKRIRINLSVNNVLNSTSYSNLAFEDYRLQENSSGKLDPSLFPTRYRYATGRTYFLNVAYKFY